MRSDDLEDGAGQTLHSFMPGVVPSPRFVRDLSEEIQRAARRKVGYGVSVPFEDVIAELRKLVRLLRRTLVPVSPRPEFIRTLKGQLDENATLVVTARHRRWRWLMVGGVVGSMVSLAGLVAALLLRRRHEQLHTKKTMGVV